jgi:multidrug efflux pump subunit AcrA (membrane-fusion protein)
MPVATVPIVSEVTPRERIWDGTVEAVNQSTVSAQTSGRVAELGYDVNDFVPKGAVIARFTDTEQRAALRIANATLEEAIARLDEAG